jgi:HAD superfamily hydrolase (TIGR01549 family)
MVKAIIFDLQGTLVENGIHPSPIKQVKNILRINEDFHEYVVRFEKVFMTKKHENLTEAFKAVAKEFDVNPPEFVYEKLVGLWNKNRLLSTLFPDTLDVLDSLKDHKLILVANIDCFSKEVIDKFDLGKYFEKIYLSFEQGKLKSEIYNEISSEFDNDVIIVGDSIESDMKPAELIGVKSVLVDRGSRMEYPNKISDLFELKEML